MTNQITKADNSNRKTSTTPTKTSTNEKYWTTPTTKDANNPNPEI
jgi:hypothetical protein